MSENKAIWRRANQEERAEITNQGVDHVLEIRPEEDLYITPLKPITAASVESARKAIQTTIQDLLSGNFKVDNSTIDLGALIDGAAETVDEAIAMSVEGIATVTVQNVDYAAATKAALEKEDMPFESGPGAMD